jgi:hypothetical protein
VRASGEYARRIQDLLAVVPDLRLELAEHTPNGDVVFLRWPPAAPARTGCLKGLGMDGGREPDYV